MSQESTSERPGAAWWSIWSVAMIGMSLAMALWVLGEALLGR